MNLHSFSSNLDDDKLTDNNYEPNTTEHWVSENSLENVEFIINLSGSEHVEYLQEDEYIEVDCQMS